MNIQPDLRVPTVPGLSGLYACWPHAGEAAVLVRALKYGRATAAITPMAEAMACVLGECAGLKRHSRHRRGTRWAPVVTWAPCTPQRRRGRGFDPAELLARATARRLGLRARCMLRRVDEVAQTSRGRSGRLAGPELRARSRPAGGDGPAVLVVDDVCTTGSTLRVAAEVLRTAGFSQVFAVVATVAPAPPNDAPGPWPAHTMTGQHAQLVGEAPLAVPTDPLAHHGAGNHQHTKPAPVDSIGGSTKRR